MSSTDSPMVKGSIPVRGNFFAVFFALIQFWQMWQNDLFREKQTWLALEAFQCDNDKIPATKSYPLCGSSMTQSNTLPLTYADSVCKSEFQDPCSSKRVSLKLVSRDKLVSDLWQLLHSFKASFWPTIFGIFATQGEKR